METEDSFYARLADPGSWLEKAASHHLLAERLWRDLWQLMSDRPATERNEETVALIHGVAFFTATAIENALKARIVRKQPELVASELRHPLTSHNLKMLAQAAAARMEPAERDLLAPLTEYLTWAARYPGPRKPGASVERELGFPPRVALDFAARLLDD